MNDPLPSWCTGIAKSAVVDFVARVTKEGSSDFVAPAERIATFDNDGTLWCEQPMQVQLFFAQHRLKELAANDPTLRERQPYKAFLEDDMKTLAALGKKVLFEIALATHANITTDEFDRMVRAWFRTTEHPKLRWPIAECVYRPQLELLSFLRENGFKNFIVSGGGVDFMRNSDGDLAMLRYTTSGPRPHLALLLHHDDGKREFAYDRDFRLSPLAEALDRAVDYGITVVSIKRDWHTVFPEPR